MLKVCRNVFFLAFSCFGLHNLLEQKESRCIPILRILFDLSMHVKYFSSNVYFNFLPSICHIFLTNKNIEYDLISQKYFLKIAVTWECCVRKKNIKLCYVFSYTHSTTKTGRGHTSFSKVWCLKHKYYFMKVFRQKHCKMKYEGRKLYSICSLSQ